MSWDIEVHEKVYQRLANEIFFRILRGEYALGAKLPSYICPAKRHFFGHFGMETSDPWLENRK